MLDISRAHDADLERCFWSIFWRKTKN